MAAKYIPGQFRDPLGLARRVYRNGGKEGRFALLLAALGVLLSPLDLLLARHERRLYAGAAEPRLPLILVAGAPRSGTTLVAQVLIRYLAVDYLDNLTSLFPRSPLTARRVFGKWIRQHPPDFRAYYGRTRHLSGPNDALYIWDRWSGVDRREIPDGLSADAGRRMRQFFGALEEQSGRPLVAKNNSLNTYAALVARELPTATFLCLDRDPVFLAQSLLLARYEIEGDPSVPYGVDHRLSSPVAGEDPIDDVCRQVVFHQRLAVEQQRLVGEDRFRFVSYEGFCRDPGAVVEELAAGVLGSKDLVDPSLARLRPFQASRRPRLEPRTLEKIEQTLSDLGAGAGS